MLVVYRRGFTDQLVVVYTVQWHLVIFPVLRWSLPLRFLGREWRNCHWALGCNMDKKTYFRADLSFFFFKYKDFQIKKTLATHTHTHKEKQKQNSNYTLEVSASWGLGCWQSLGASGWHSDPEFSCWPAALRGPAESLQLPPGKQKEDSQSWYLNFCLRRAIRLLYYNN